MCCQISANFFAENGVLSDNSTISFLKEEISALEAKLAKLKEKEQGFTEAIKEEESKIESVKMTFSPQQNALGEQQQEIEAREKSLQEEFVSKLTQYYSLQV